MVDGIQMKYIFGVLAFSAVSGVLEIMMRMILYCDGGWQRKPRGSAVAVLSSYEL